jgi:hypothetical protein
MRKLWLNYCSIFPRESVIYLAEMLPRTSLTHLELSLHSCDETLMRTLSQGFRDSKITHLTLKECQLSLASFEILAEGAKESKITDLKIGTRPSSQDREVREALVELQTLLESKKPDFVLQLSLQDQDKKAENFTVKACKMSGKIAACVCCPRATLCDDLPELLTAELIANRQLSAEFFSSGSKLKLLLPDGRLLKPSSDLLLEQFEGSPPKKSRIN